MCVFLCVRTHGGEEVPQAGEELAGLPACVPTGGGPWGLAIHPGISRHLQKPGGKDHRITTKFKIATNQEWIMEGRSKLDGNGKMQM